MPVANPLHSCANLCVPRTTESANEPRRAYIALDIQVNESDAMCTHQGRLEKIPSLYRDGLSPLFYEEIRGEGLGLRAQFQQVRPG